MMGSGSGSGTVAAPASGSVMRCVARRRAAVYVCSCRHTAAVGDDVEGKLAGCLRMTEALLEGMDAAIRSADANDALRFASYHEYMRKYNQVLDAVAKIEPVDAPVDRYNIDAVPSKFDTIGMQQQGFFESVRGN